MKKDVFSSLFFLIVSIYFSIESYRLGLGEWARPGSGYFPFGAALIFGIISLSVMVKALREKRPREIPIDSGERLHWQNIVLVLCSMFVYILIFASTLWSFYKFNLIIRMDNIFGFDKLTFGMILGSVIFIIL